MVTWSALGGSTAILISLAMIGFGILSVFAAGMSSAPSENAGKGGCFLALAGIVVFIGGVASLIFG